AGRSGLLALRLLSGVGLLGSLGLVSGVGSLAALGGQATDGGIQLLGSGVHSLLVVLRQGGVSHHGLGVGQSGAEGGHGLSGVAGEVHALGLADEVFQDVLVGLEALSQDGVQQSLSHRLDVLIHGVAVSGHVLGGGQSVHQLLPVGLHVLVGVGHHVLGLGDETVQLV